MRYMWSAMDSGLGTPARTHPVRGVVCMGKEGVSRRE